MSRAGKRAFRRCDVKEVELSTFVYEKEGGGVRHIKDAKKGRVYNLAGANANLHCPRTESPLVKVSSEDKAGMSKVQAVKSLEELAGELLCRDCRFSTMTPVQVSIARAELDLAEAERIRAHQLLTEARAELDAIDRSIPELQ